MMTPEINAFSIDGMPFLLVLADEPATIEYVDRDLAPVIIPPDSLVPLDPSVAGVAELRLRATIGDRSETATLRFDAPTMAPVPHRGKVVPPRRRRGKVAEAQR